MAPENKTLRKRKVRKDDYIDIDNMVTSIPWNTEDTEYVDINGVTHSFSMNKCLTCNLNTNIEYCSKCLRLEKGILIKTSDIPDAGYGVFAAIDIPLGWRISFIGGEVLTNQEFSARYDTISPCYVVHLGANSVMDCITSRCSAAFVNRAYPGQKNAKLVLYAGKATIKSTVRISCGSEIYFPYGR